MSFSSTSQCCLATSRLELPIRTGWFHLNLLVNLQKTKGNNWPLYASWTSAIIKELPKSILAKTQNWMWSLLLWFEIFSNRQAVKNIATSTSFSVSGGPEAKLPAEPRHPRWNPPCCFMPLPAVVPGASVRFNLFRVRNLLLCLPVEGQLLMRLLWHTGFWFPVLDFWSWDPV